MIRKLLLAVALAGTLMSCDRGKITNRREELLIMASEEVTFITNAKERLTRQLNIADLQISMGHKPDAAKTLAAARDNLTATAAADMDDLSRMSGWVSISELARAADDKVLAGKACDDGRELLSSIKPDATRCEYVLGLAEEIYQLRGQPDAARLVIQGGQWASTMMDKTTRRQALVAFMDRLMTYEDYDGARKVLRQEPDAVWRADILTGLARTETPEDKVAGNSIREAQMEAHAASAMVPSSRDQFYGRRLDYQSNLKQAK